MSKVGFIGTGVMGHAMAGHLMDAGFELVVYNRTPKKAEELVSRGALLAPTPAQLAKQCDTIITMVGYPSDVEEVYFGSDGIIENAPIDALLIDMTTSSPTLAQRIFEKASQSGKHALDAPVSGGDVGAKNATLTIMVGGEKADFDRAVPLFKVMGTNYSLHGGAGCGQHCKMANQINIAATMMGMAESLAYARAAGLDPLSVIDTLSGGSSQTWSLSNYGPRVLKGDFQPGFFIKHFIKDLRIALEQAEEMGIDLPATKLAKQLYDRLSDQGCADLGTQAIVKLYFGEC